MCIALTCSALLFMRIFGGIPVDDPAIVLTYDMHSLANFGTFWFVSAHQPRSNHLSLYSLITIDLLYSYTCFVFCVWFPILTLLNPNISISTL